MQIQVSRPLPSPVIAVTKCYPEQGGSPCPCVRLLLLVSWPALCPRSRAQATPMSSEAHRLQRVRLQLSSHKVTVFQSNNCAASLPSGCLVCLAFFLPPVCKVKLCSRCMLTESFGDCQPSAGAQLGQTTRNLPCPPPQPWPGVQAPVPDRMLTCCLQGATRYGSVRIRAFCLQVPSTEPGTPTVTAPSARPAPPGARAPLSQPAKGKAHITSGYMALAHSRSRKCSAFLSKEVLRHYLAYLGFRDGDRPGTVSILCQHIRIHSRAWDWTQVLLNGFNSHHERREGSWELVGVSVL